MRRELLTPYVLFLLEVVTALTVESGSPDALCPELAQTREAVAARLGTLRVTRAGWRARYTIGHAPDSTGGDFVRLELFDPDGIARLQRDLPMTGKSCVDMAQALALILDRYFRTLTAEPPAEGEPSPEPPPDTGAEERRRSARSAEAAPRGAQVAPQAKPAVKPSSGAAPGRPLPARAPRSERRWLLANAGVAVVSAPSSPGVSFGIATEPVPRLELGIGGVALLAHQQELVEGGIVSQQNVPLRGWLTYAIARGGVDLHLGPEVLGNFAIGRGVDGRDKGARFLLGVGPRAVLRGWTSRRLGVGVIGSLDFTVTHGRFLVGSNEVLAPSPVQGLVALEITWLLFG